MYFNIFHFDMYPYDLYGFIFCGVICEVKVVFCSVFTIICTSN